MSEEVKVQLKGPQAILAIVVLVAIGGFQWFRGGVSSFGGGPTTAIKDWIWSEYHTDDLSEAIENAEEDMSEENVEKMLAAAKRRMAMDKVEIKDLSIRKSGKRGYIVRVDFTLSGSPPPDGKGRRYLHLEKRSPGGWRVTHESSAFSYYASLF